MTKGGVVALGIWACAIAGAISPTETRADSVSDAIEMCSGCHGEQGTPTEKNIPNIWGQNRAYILNQLHDFKTGRRKNDIMSGMVEQLSKTDMEALATHFSQQPWPDLKQPAPSADETKAARAVLSQSDCEGCHERYFQGAMVRPRLAGQQAEYLIKTMQDFRSNERKNYIGMSVIMRDLSDDQIKSVANYLASRTVPTLAAN